MPFEKIAIGIGEEIRINHDSMPVLSEASSAADLPATPVMLSTAPHADNVKSFTMIYPDPMPPAKLSWLNNPTRVWAVAGLVVGFMLISTAIAVRSTQ